MLAGCRVWDLGNGTCTIMLRKALDVPFNRTDVFKNSFFVRICHLGNDLPLSIRE